MDHAVQSHFMFAGNYLQCTLSSKSALQTHGRQCTEDNEASEA